MNQNFASLLRLLHQRVYMLRMLLQGCWEALEMFSIHQAKIDFLELLTSPCSETIGEEVWQNIHECTSRSSIKGTSGGFVNNNKPQTFFCCFRNCCLYTYYIQIFQDRYICSHWSGDRDCGRTLHAKIVPKICILSGRDGHSNRLFNFYKW